ncbi:high affinity immunoglobulin gamma Fc receptor I-like [Rana temporaria]|uniref:high affinity immunoglobulin gamma Fc receptor I-like n=1 Tax=Rana temporaria TaxID=8407 RepID=UPI001AACE1F9|nr:high affinity immunoglobulin gamma Fc receptor I-like [Rana temporaria]
MLTVALLSCVELFSKPEIEMIPVSVSEGNQMILKCNTIVIRNNTELQFAFYKNIQKIQEFNSSHQYVVSSAHLEDSGNYYCEVRTLTRNVKKKSEELNVDIQGNTELFIILIPLALGMLLLLVAILVTLFICSKRRSSVKPQEPTTEGFNTFGDCDVEPEITYSILAMFPMSQDAPVTTKENHENNVVYAATNPKSRRQPAADPDCIYQNI